MEDNFEIKIKEVAQLAHELGIATQQLEIYKNENELLLRERNRYAKELKSMTNMATLFEKRLVCAKIAALQEDNRQVIELVDETVSENRFKELYMLIARE